jgi:hypothetical protein
MRAQYMPELSDYSWPTGMNVAVPVGVIRAAMPSMRIAHDAQDARRTGLQHIDNNYPGATARDWQTPKITCHLRARSSRP